MLPRPGMKMTLVRGDHLVERQHAIAVRVGLREVDEPDANELPKRDPAVVMRFFVGLRVDP